MSDAADLTAQGSPERAGTTDCRSEHGVMIGLVDGMIAQSRVVARYLSGHPAPPDALRHALADLSGDEDVALLTDERWRFLS